MAKEVLDRKVVPAGEYIFREGDKGERAYLVQQGEIDIIKKSKGKDLVIGKIRKGGIFGEMALIDDQARMASARAAEPTTIVVISRKAFSEKLAATDPFIRALLGIFVGTIRSTTKTALQRLEGEKQNGNR